MQVPSMLEVRAANITTRPDGDMPGDQYRAYEFPGMGHVDSRDNVRLQPNPCEYPLSNFPMQAYMSVALIIYSSGLTRGQCRQKRIES